MGFPVPEKTFEVICRVTVERHGFKSISNKKHGHKVTYTFFFCQIKQVIQN